MYRYQVWVTCAILLALAPLSGLYGNQVRPSDNNNRPTAYLEDFSALSKLDYLQDTHLDTEKNELTLQLDDHIAQQESVIVTDGESVYVIWRDLRNDQGDIYIQKLNGDGQRMWPQDRQINDDTDASDGTTQSNPAAAMDSVGNLWVVWVDDRQGQNDLYAKYLTLQIDFVDEENPWGADMQIPSASDQANQAGPAVVTYGTDLIVAWHDNRNGIDFDIYAQRINEVGEPQWENSERPIHTNVIGSQSDPAIAIDGTGNVMVAWLDQRVGNGDIYYTQRALSAENSIESANWSTESKANETAYGARKPPALVMGADGVAQICWLSSTNTGNYIYLQTIQSNGTPSLPNQRVNTSTVNAGVNPAAALLGNKIAIGWKDISTGHLYIDIGDVPQAQGAPEAVLIDPDGADGSNNRSENLSLAFLNDNKLFAVWVDSRSGRETDIYGQKLGADGKPIWGHARFINDSTGRIDQQNPAVVVDSDDNSIVAWYSERGGQSNLFLQKFDSDGGQPWKRQIPVSDDDIQGESLAPDLAVLNNDVLITWSDRRTGTSRVYVQRFDPEGNRVWQSGQSASQATDSTINQFNPQIVVGVIDTFIAWQESEGTTSRIVLQKLNDDGLPAWSENQKVRSSDTASLQFPALALTNDKVVIIWTSTTAGSTDLYLATRDRSNGIAPFTTPIQVNEFSGLVDQLNPPALAADPNGNIVVVWTDRRESGIYARGYHSQRGLEPEAQKLNQTPGSFSPRPDIAFLPTINDMIVVWQGLNQGQFFIYAQRVNAEGETQWPVNAINAELAIQVNSNNSQEAWLPAIAAGSSGMSSIVWRDERNMNQDIYLHRLDMDGKHWDVGDVAVIATERFYRSKGIVRSSPFDGTDGEIDKALLTYEGELNNGQITFQLTNGNNDVKSIHPGKIYTFTSPSTVLSWQAQLTQTNVAALGQSPIIDAIHIDYSNVRTTAQLGDAYEPDDECGSAWPIQPDGVVQERTLHNNATDVDWISFRTAPGTDYILLATPEHDDATLRVEFHRTCSSGVDRQIGPATGTQDNPAHMFLSNLGSTEYYVKISSISTATETTPYELSIRPAPSSGQAIVVVGIHDTLREADGSGNRAKRTLEENGFTPLYLNYASDPDMMQELEKITQEKPPANSDAVLIVYLVGQIDATSGFKYLENQFLTASALDLWLSNLENTGKIGNAIVVIEADNAGLFGEDLSGPNRVIVTSTNTASTAKQTPQGFLFSDAFWLAMGQGYSVQQSFIIANRVVEEIGLSCPSQAADCLQVPSFFDISNQDHMIGLRISDTLKIPVIKNLTYKQTQTDSITIEVSFSDSIDDVAAHIRPAAGGVESVELVLDSTHSGSLTLELNPEVGLYYITIYGWGSNFALLPIVYKYYSNSIYFPIISRSK